MFKIIFISAFLLFFIIFILFILTFIKYRKLQKKYVEVKNDTSKLLIAFKRLRYGDVNVRVENLSNNDLENVSNRLFETIADREMMIKEYQQTLSSKNLSLEEIIRKEKQLQQLKEDSIATLTHDMKVPIIAELNSINFLLEGRFGDLNQKQIKALELMKSSNQELKDLIDSILEAFRLEQGGLKLNKRQHNLNSFLTSVIEEMHPILLKGNHKIILNTHNTENLLIEFDDFQIKRVIKNLLQNAISFSPVSEEINLVTSISNDFFHLSIINKGIGICEDELKLIFNKYYSGHSKFRKAGTGLGLFISQQIVIAHGGQLNVETKDDETNFILFLPIRS